MCESNYCKNKKNNMCQREYKLKGIFYNIGVRRAILEKK